MFVDDAEVLRWAFTDADGNPIDLTGAGVTLELVGPMQFSTTATILVPGTDGKVEVQFSPGFFFVAGDYTGRWQIQFPSGQTTSVLGVVVRVYDSTIHSRLYANLLDLEGIVGPVAEPDIGLQKLEIATDIVQQYIYVPIDPVQSIPGPIRTATAILAARLYAAAMTNTQGIASERIGDYQISYQRDGGGVGQIANDPVLANLLARWRSRMGDVYVGPGVDDNSLPITGHYTEVDTIEGEPIP